MNVPSDLFESAKKARLSAYSPYSGHKVGSSVRTESGQVFSGCNVENSSYGATVCAERVAILKAVSEGHQKFSELCVVTDARPPWAPCGMCRQVIAEFAASEMVIHLFNLSGDTQSFSLGQLFPWAFSPENLR